MCSIWNGSPGTRKPCGKHPLDGEMFLNKNKNKNSMETAPPALERGQTSEPSHCTCAIDAYRHKLVPTVGWLIIPHLKRHLIEKTTGIVHYGLIGIILSWAKLPPYTIHRFPGQVRIVYQYGRRFHLQGCCKHVYAPFRTKEDYVRRSIRKNAGYRWNTPWTHHLRRLY